MPALVALLLLAGFVPPPPATPRHPVVETLHGVRIEDPYRWLENRGSAETEKWIKAQNRYSDRILKSLPGRADLRRRIMPLARLDSYDVPFERGTRLFFSHKRPTDEQPVLYWRDGLHGADHVFIDPQPLSKDHSTTASYLDATSDGRLVAYQIRKGGEDETVVRIRDMRTGHDLPDSLPRGNYWSFSLLPNGKAFYYSLHRNLIGVRVYVHPIGSPAGRDQELFGKGYDAQIGIGANVTEDGRYLLVNVSRGWDRNDLYVSDLDAKGPIVPLVTGMDAVYDPAYAEGKFYVRTDNGASRRRIVEIDPADPARGNWKTIVPEGRDSIEAFSCSAGRLYVQGLHDVSSRISSYDLAGNPLGDVPLPGLGSASVPSAQWTNRDAFFSFTSYATPSTIVHVDGRSGRTDTWARPKTPGFDPARFMVRQAFAASKDGTKVPLFMVYRKGYRFNGKSPTLVTGYGGFDASETPYFSAGAAAWIFSGGVFVDVAMRGGGEYGEAWHRAGMLGNKQRVFDDFFGAAEWLIRNHITSSNHLAIEGGSNGGLLMGAAITQRPDLYRAVLCEVPLLDMLRYDQFLQGPQWVPEYGSAKDPEQFKWLYRYSPYQHVRKGLKYPAVLFYTGDGDTRVAPLHARKMTALLQWANGGDRPILLHYETKSGHSGGESVTKRVDNQSMMLAFLGWQVGLAPKTRTRP